VGNANEVVECIDLLKGSGRQDLLENSLELSERMLVVAGVAKDRTEASALCRRALDSGQALERLRLIIERQGGDPRVIDDSSRLPQAPSEHVLRAPFKGFVTDLDAGLIGRAAVTLGGGRDKVDDQIDPAVGIMIPATVGDAVSAGDAVLRVQYRSEKKLEGALPLLMEAVRIGETPRPRTPLIIDEVL
jgi:thymidine phosphorylase